MRLTDDRDGQLVRVRIGPSGRDRLIVGREATGDQGDLGSTAWILCHRSESGTKTGRGGGRNDRRHNHDE